MPPAELHITVYGTPGPQGSKTHVGKGRMIESSKKVAPWREDVRAAAGAAMAETPDWNPLAPSLTMTAAFFFQRPRSHYRTGASTSHLLRPGSPYYVATRPDLDKLVRSTCDALTSAGVYVDDSRVVLLSASKVYAGHYAHLERPGAHIILEAHR